MIGKIASSRSGFLNSTNLASSPSLRPVVRTAFTNEWFDRLRFDIPDVAVQRRQLDMKRVIIESRTAATAAAESIRRLLDTPVDIPAARVVFTGRLAELLKSHGGNSGLTEEFVYHNLPLNDTDAVTIRSGATRPENEFGSVRAAAMLPSGKSLKVFTEECLIVMRKGFYAGTVRHWPGGAFAPNDDINVFSPRKEYKDAINLRWFAAQFAPHFCRAATSRLHNPTFSQEWLSRTEIHLPDRKYQDEAMATKAGQITALELLKRVVQESDSLLGTRFRIDS